MATVKGQTAKQGRGTVEPARKTKEASTQFAAQAKQAAAPNAAPKQAAAKPPSPPAVAAPKAKAVAAGANGADRPAPTMQKPAASKAPAQAGAGPRTTPPAAAVAQAATKPPAPMQSGTESARSPAELARKLDGQIKAGAPLRQELKTLAANPLASRIADAVGAVATAPARALDQIAKGPKPVVDADQAVVRDRVGAMNEREAFARRAVAALAGAQGRSPADQKRLASAAQQQVAGLQAETRALNAAINTRDNNRARTSETVAGVMGGIVNTIDRINSTVAMSLGQRLGGAAGGGAAAIGYDTVMGTIERQVGDRVAQVVTGSPVPDSLKAERNTARGIGAGVNIAMMGATSATNAALQSIKTSGSAVGSPAFSLGLQKAANTERLFAPAMRTLSGATAGTAVDAVASRIENKPFDPVGSFLTNATGEATGEGIAVAAPAIARRLGFGVDVRQAANGLLDRPVRTGPGPDIAQMSPADRRKLGEALDAEFLRAAAQAGENPATPLVRNKQWLLDSLEVARKNGQEAGVFLQDGNNVSRFARKLGDKETDKAIAGLTESLNAAAARFNAAFENRFVAVPGRDAGDEEFALILAHARNPDKKVPDGTLRTFSAMVHEEKALRNATRDIPLPTSTSSAKVIRPGDHEGGVTLKSLLDHIDHAGPAALHQHGTPFFKNGGVVLGRDGSSELVLGPNYVTQPGQPLQTYRLSQGGFPAQAQAGGRPDVETAVANRRWNVSDGERARAQLLPGALPTEAGAQLPPAELERAIWGVPDPAKVDWADDTQSRRALASLAGGINAARLAAPIEAVYRDLQGQGINVLNQPAGMARLQYILDQAKANDGAVAVIGREPRGLKDVNDKGMAIGSDGEARPVAHGGGNRIVTDMILAEHDALVQVLGPNYHDKGDGTFIRDRGKRFLAAFGPAVSENKVRVIAEESSRLYNQMKPLFDLPDGTKTPILFPRPDGSLTPFAPSSSYAAVRTFPAQGGPSDVWALRDVVTAPLPYADGTVSPFSALDIAKDIIDGQSVARGVQVPPSTEATSVWVSNPTSTYETRRRSR